MLKIFKGNHDDQELYRIFFENLNNIFNILESQKINTNVFYCIHGLYRSR